MGQQRLRQHVYAYMRTYANNVLWLELGPPNSEVPLERFEAVAVPVVASGRCKCNVQDMTPWERAMWSQGKQLFCNAEKEGFVELALEVHKPGSYDSACWPRRRPTTARSAWRWTESRWSRKFDLYCGRVSPSGTWNWQLHLHGGPAPHPLRKCGKNTASAGYSFGIDAIDLLPHEP